MTYINTIKQGYKGVLLAVIAGALAIAIKQIVGWPILDPLLVAMVIGIALRSFVKFDEKTISALSVVPMLFIPVGVVFYGAVNLDFIKVASVDADYIFILFIVFSIYTILALFLANIFGLKEKVGYLITAGSTICGASAIAITSKAIDADPDEVSSSLIPVFISALIGLFIILPLAAFYLKISELNYGVFAGSVLQFTGFVKASVANSSPEIKSIALSVKAVRYLGLLFIIPLFASFIKNRFYVPWYLWAFLGAGLLFSFVPGLSAVAKPICKTILIYLWSIAMGAIGLNANIKVLFSKEGLKAFVVSLLAFIIAAGVFLLSISFI